MEDGSLTPTELGKILRDAQEDATVRRNSRDIKLAYWWNGEVVTAIEECNRARRVLKRTVRREGRNREREVRLLHERYRDAKKALTKAIKDAKKETWRKVCDELEEDVWGHGYCIVTRHLRGLQPEYEITDSKRLEILNELFPSRADRWKSETVAKNPPPVTAEEVKEVIETG